MTDKTLLILGGLGAGALILYLLSRKATQQQQAQTAVLANQYANTTAGQVGGIISSIGSFFNSGALQLLEDSFLDTGSNNEPGLITPSSSSSSNSSAANLNTPGLNTAVSTTSVWGANYGPQESSSDVLESSLYYASLGEES